nr:MAG TPA: hypothetical protein [Caudoviricetes sp.]
MNINEKSAALNKERLNSLMDSLRELEDLNSDLLVIITFDGAFVKIKIKSKSDPYCWCDLPIMLIDHDSRYTRNEIGTAQGVVDILIDLNRFYGVRKAVLGKLAK